MNTVIKPIPLHQIKPSPLNPRKTFNEDALRELADNISKQGLLQPITVRPTVMDGSQQMYEIVCGERRYRACVIIQMIEVPCIIREMSDDEAFDAMITENLQRKDVDPIEEAVAFQLLTERGQSTDELAVRFGKSVRYVQDRIRLGMLIEPLRKAVSAGEIPLRGGYLLARLSQAEQEEYVDDEFDPDGEGDVSVSEIEDWLDRHFRRLWHAPFHDGSSLNETWNPDGKLIRRCYDCECNTCNQGCLFADMKTEEPQCIDEVCYQRKIQVYYDYLIERDKALILCGDEKPAAGRIALVGDGVNMYNEKDKARFMEMKERMEQQGFRVFSCRQLSNRLWGSDREKEFNAGRAVKALTLEEMARGYRQVEYEYYRIPGTENTDGKPSNYPSQLVERATAIENKAKKKIDDYAKKNFDRDKYVGRTAALEEWEWDIISIIVYNALNISNDVRKRLMPHITSSWCSPSYQDIHDFRKKQGEYGDINRWMRHAISDFVGTRSDCMRELITQLDPLAQPTFQKIRKDADKRIQDIHEELHELGYDEKGNKI